MRDPLRKANNTLPADELIKTVYTDEELENVLQRLSDSDSEETVSGLLKECNIPIECVRNPRVYDETYMPYVLLKSSSGAREIIYFDPDTEIILMEPNLIRGDFLSSEEMRGILRSIEVHGIQFKDWMDIVDKYCCGDSNGALYSWTALATTDGVFWVCTRYDEIFHICEEIMFFSDEQLFAVNPQLPIDTSWCYIWPLLPIDKQTE